MENTIFFFCPVAGAAVPNFISQPQPYLVFFLFKGPKVKFWNNYSEGPRPFFQPIFRPVFQKIWPENLAGTFGWKIWLELWPKTLAEKTGRRIGRKIG